MNKTDSKIRLELIKEADICSAIIDLAKKKPWPGPIVDEVVKDVAWLIEQAERATKFEERLKERGLYTKRLKLRLEESEDLARNRLSKNYSIQSHFDSNVKLLEEWQEENKRFREALEKIVKMDKESWDTEHEEFGLVARQALEVERCD